MVRKYLSNKEFVRRVNDLTNGEYTPIENYKGTQVRLLFKHNYCNSVFKCTPNRFVNQGQRCPKQNVLIEYQGLQHYEPKEYFGGDDRFKIQCYHDKLKTLYAINNKFILLQIPYKINTYRKVTSFLSYWLV